VWINRVYLKFYYLVNKSNAQDTIDIKTKIKNFDILELKAKEMNEINIIQKNEIKKVFLINFLLI